MKGVIEQWHDTFEGGQQSNLADLLADDVVFHSPVVHRPLEGKAITLMYLESAGKVLNNGSFQYVREVVGERDAVLEFVTELDGIHVNGIDMIRWNDEGKIVDFKVMVRPLKAIQSVHAMMGKQLEAVT